MQRCKSRARLVSLSSCRKIETCRSVAASLRSLRSAISSSLSERDRTRSTTRPSREDVDRIMLPQAEISTAGGKQVTVAQNLFKGKIYLTIDHNLWAITGNGDNTELLRSGDIYDPAISPDRSEEHMSELQSHSFISYAVF